MKSLIVVVALLGLVACQSAKVEPISSATKAEAPALNANQKAALKAQRVRLIRAYWIAVITWISRFDDGVSPVDQIAKAAVKANVKLLKEATLASLNEMGGLSAGEKLLILSTVPEQRHYDQAVSEVLKWRRKRSGRST